MKGKPYLEQTLMIITLVLFLIIGLNKILFPSILNYTEGISIWAGKIILENKTLYGDINQFPFSYHAYPIGFPLICASLFAIFGPNLITCRLISFLSSAGILFFVYALLKSKTQDKKLSLFAAQNLCVLFMVNKFFCLARVDWLEIFFLFSGLYYFISYLKIGNLTRFYLALTLFTCSIWVKFSGFPIIITCFIYAIISSHASKHRKQLMIGITIFSLANMVIFAYLYMQTSGQFYLHSIQYQAIKEFDWNNLQQLLIAFFPMIFPFFLLAGWGIFRTKDQSLMKLLFFVSWLLYLFTSAKKGADINYAIEPMIFTVILSYFALLALKRRLGTTQFKNILIAIIVYLSLLAVDKLVMSRPQWLGGGISQRSRTAVRVGNECFGDGFGRGAIFLHHK